MEAKKSVPLALNTSIIQLVSGIAMASDVKYAVDTHPLSDGDKPISPAMLGRDALTIDISSEAIKAPNDAAKTEAQRPAFVTI